MQKIQVTSHDLFTLDTYNTFDFDSGYSLHCYNIEEDGHNPDEYDFSYDKDGYLKALAENAIDFYNEDCTDDIIKSYTLIDGSIYSPSYYNYTTDSADYEIEYNNRKLDAYIKENESEYIKNCDNHSYYIASPLENEEEKLAYYFKKTFGHLSDVYIMHQFENVCDHEYITYSNYTKEDLEDFDKKGAKYTIDEKGWSNGKDIYFITFA